MSSSRRFTGSSSAAIVYFGAMFAVPHLLLSQATPSPTPAAKPGISCSIRRTPASLGDIAFANVRYTEATDFYQKESQSAGDEGERTHNALIRSLLRNGKNAEAGSNARAWVAKSPTDAWAQDSLAEVQLHDAAIDAAGSALRTAVVTNFCNARAHADYAQYLDFAGYHASAKSQIEIAHTLDPIDDDIATTWIRLQPRLARLAAVNAYLERAIYLSESQRKSLEEERTALAGPPATPCGLVSPVAATTIPLYAIRDGNKTSGVASNVLWGLVVVINGKQRRLQIDSAASGIVLKHTAASALALTANGISTTRGFGNQAGMTTTRSSVHSVQIAGVEFHDCPVETLEKDTVFETWGAGRHFMEGQDGLIGIDIFRNFLLTLDFPGHILKLAPLPPSTGNSAIGEAALPLDPADNALPPIDRSVDQSMASWTKVFRTGHQIFVPVRLNNGPTRLFLIDTGISGDMISSIRAREITSVEKTDMPANANGGAPIIISDDGEVIGAGGIAPDSEHTHATGAVTLDFGGVRQPAHPLAASDKETYVGNTEIAGALGSTTLHQLSIQIDLRDQLVKFLFDPSRLTKCVPNVTLDDCY